MVGSNVGGPGQADLQFAEDDARRVGSILTELGGYASDTVGMRGAGDANHDGQVSIEEAYRYAYQQTLLATAETAVGGQHVSFEVDLKGHGEVPLSFPRTATSSIELPVAAEGNTLVTDRRARAVVAELYKARGGVVRIAVAPGDYEVLVRHGAQLTRCQVTAGGGGTAVELSRCTTEAVAIGVSKGSPRCCLGCGSSSRYSPGPSATTTTPRRSRISATTRPT